MDKLLALIQLIWVKEQLQKDFKDTSIIHIYILEVPMVQWLSS